MWGSVQIFYVGLCMSQTSYRRLCDKKRGWCTSPFLKINLFLKDLCQYITRAKVPGYWLWKVTVSSLASRSLETTGTPFLTRTILNTLPGALSSEGILNTKFWGASLQISYFSCNKGAGQLIYLQNLPQHGTKFCHRIMLYIAGHQF